MPLTSTLRDLPDRLLVATRRRPVLLDVALTVALLVGGLVGLSFDVRHDAGRHPVDLLACGLTVVGALPYLLRRRAPLAVLVVAAAPLLALMYLGYPSGILGSGLFVAAFSVAALRGRRQVVAAAIVILTLLTGVAVVTPGYLRVGELGVNLVLFGGALALGEATRTRRLYVEALEERARSAEREAVLAERSVVSAEREREEAARRAVSEERLRIAQELHDIVAHSLGVIALQAGVGAHVIASDPAEAKESLVAISTTSRETLSEIRRILGALRGPDGELTYAPAPGLDDLDALAGTVSAAGVPVTVRVEGRREGLPAGVDLTAYRIVQEALTNVLRHAGPARAEVVIRHLPGCLEIEVLDDGAGGVGAAAGAGADRGAGAFPGGGGAAPPGGHGLLGMRERVGVWGGSLATGVREEGGFAVRARLPFGDPS